VKPGRFALILMLWCLPLACLASGTAQIQIDASPSLVPSLEETITQKALPSATSTVTPAGSRTLFPSTAAPEQPTPRLLSEGMTLESQWAVRSFAEPETAGDPDLVDGLFDTYECGRPFTAWVPPASDKEAVITLIYLNSLIPTQINIHESGNPGGVFRVEVLGENGDSEIVYSANPGQVEPCPRVLSIPVDSENFSKSIRISVAASQAPTQIDAVEMVGYDPLTLGAVFWRVGGSIKDKQNEKYSTLLRMDTDSQGNLFAAGGKQGVQVLDIEGNWYKTIKPDGSTGIIDVKADAWGSLILADEVGKIFVTDKEGHIQNTFGDRGNAAGQFDTLMAVAVSPFDGNIYTLDLYRVNQQNQSRLQVFTSDTGEFIRSMQLKDVSLMGGMDFGPDNMLYVADPGENVILKVDPKTGQVLTKLAGEYLRDTGPDCLSIDADGNMYVLVNSNAKGKVVFKFDSKGVLLGRLGRFAASNESIWPEGSFYDPAGVAVTPDGRFVFISDSDDQATFLTAYQIELPSAEKEAGGGE
jgi:hypothetical protein